MEPVRFIHWILFLAVTGCAFYAFSRVVYSRYRYVSLGKNSPLEGSPRERLQEAAAKMFGHGTLLKDKKSGIMHLILFYGFIALQLGALDLILKGLWEGARLPVGPLYPLFLASQEAAVLLVLAAVAYAAYRRYIEKLPRLKRGWKPALVLFFITALMLSVLMAQGMELLWHGQVQSTAQPVSSLFAKAALGLPGLGIGAGSVEAEVWFYVFWWLHLLILLAFLIYVPQSKHAHILFAPVNLYLRKQGAPGRLSVIDFEDESAEHYGAQGVEDFKRSQLLDLYACVECGRCTSVCPASGTGKSLSPMHLITNLRDHLTAKGASITSLSPWVPPMAGAGTDASPALAEARMVGDVVSEQELWACTTCRSCEEVCPVGNEHVDKIMEMRRYLVLTEGSLPPEAARTLGHLERQGNPWGRSRKERDEWRAHLPEDMEAPLVREGKPFDYLLHVGSMGSYDPRSIRITHAFIKLMNRAGISFAVLGAEERNSGDTARRLGNEYLYRQMAEEYIEVLKQYKVRRIVTIDPHAYNTFKNEYPDFGLPPEIRVYHHSELLEDWVREGRLRPDRTLKETVVFHDPCYLGRHNGNFHSARSVLASIAGVRLAEMARHGPDSMCCGAGGGLMWLEEQEGTRRIHSARTEQALEVKPTVIATACPYCLTMMGDGLKALEEEDRVRTLDIAELLASAIEK